MAVVSNHTLIERAPGYRIYEWIFTATGEGDTLYDIGYWTDKTVQVSFPTNPTGDVFKWTGGLYIATDTAKYPTLHAADSTLLSDAGFLDMGGSDTDLISAVLENVNHIRPEISNLGGEASATFRLMVADNKGPYG